MSSKAKARYHPTSGFELKSRSCIVTKLSNARVDLENCDDRITDWIDVHGEKDNLRLASNRLIDAFKCVDDAIAAFKKG